MFSSKIFRNLFFSYIIIIFVCLFVYTSLILYENHIINNERTTRESEIITDEMNSILKERFLYAQNIVLDLNNSSTLKQLYFSIVTNEQLNSYDLLSITTELQMKQSSSRLMIDEVLIFMNSGNKAYSSSGGVINLQDTYQKPAAGFPSFMVSTVKELFGLENSERYSFSRKYLIYCDEYTYQEGSKIGTIGILFNITTLKEDIEKLLDDGYGVTIFLDEEELFSIGEVTKIEYTKESEELPGITVTLYAPEHTNLNQNTLLFFMLGTISIFSVLFILLAYRISKKYYQPIDTIEHMVMLQSSKNAEGEAAKSAASAEVGEMESIIQGISSLIGEKNKYQEKMLIISPYAQTGMLHGVLTGNMESDSIRVLTEENYLDLIKPFFIVSIVNFAYGTPPDKLQEHQQRMSDLFKMICTVFSTDELHLVYYNRDLYNVYLIANSENDHPLDELFYQIQRYISESLSGNDCIVTIGVDEVKNDIGALQDACEGALLALDEMMINGRGEVYFYDTRKSNQADYYFPKNFTEKLIKVLKKEQKEDIRQMMADIFEKNWTLDGSPEMYHALVDELHLSVIKSIKEVTDLNTTHISVEKIRSFATLEEIFQYYEAALNSAIQSITQADEEKTQYNQMEEEILKFIEEHYCEPEMSLQLLIDTFNVSSKYLSLFCKNHYDTTYLQYIQNKRIEKALELMRSKQYSLSQISQICGYTNQLTFRRNFKSVTGVNPSDFNDSEE